MSQLTSCRTGKAVPVRIWLDFGGDFLGESTYLAATDNPPSSCAYRATTSSMVQSRGETEGCTDPEV